MRPLRVRVGQSLGGLPLGTRNEGLPCGRPLVLLCRPCKPGSVPGADSGSLSFIYDGSHLPPQATYPPTSDEPSLIAGIHGLATHGTYGRMTLLPPRWALTPPFHPYPPFGAGDLRHRTDPVVSRILRRRAGILCYAPTPSRLSSCLLAWRSVLPGLSSPGLRRRRQSGPALQRYEKFPARPRPPVIFCCAPQRTGADGGQRMRVTQRKKR